MKRVMPKRRCPYCDKLMSTAGLAWGQHTRACRKRKIKTLQSPQREPVAK